jgi:predicted transposase YbfD/YdcC
MNEVANHFAIAMEKREHWKSTYAHSVRDALNNRRNNTAQDLKKELAGKCEPWTSAMVVVMY